MSLQNFCKYEVVTVAKETSVQEAASLMKKYNIGNIVVVDQKNNEKPIGIFTDRDMTIKIIAEAVDSKSITVGDAMSEDLLLLKEQQSIQEALEMMCTKGVRRAPITDKDNKVIGMVTVDDLLLLLADELASLAKLIRRQIF